VFTIFAIFECYIVFVYICHGALWQIKITVIFCVFHVIDSFLECLHLPSSSNAKKTYTIKIRFDIFCWIWIIFWL